MFSATTIVAADAVDRFFPSAAPGVAAMAGD
eukprot:SAG11_NODE_38192_length_253_cov_1.006494_1_plen_30_part_01